MLCALHFCLLGLALLACDLASWLLTGQYESPSLLGLYALRWLAVPGIGLCGGAAMLAASVRPARPWAFLAAMLMLLVCAWCWDIAGFLVAGPELQW
jgi:hypothetical protein